jgi:uncharacterized OsmC-like protein
VFDARGRSFVNVRTVRDDGPLGFSSGELLLIALGNCALGTIMESSEIEGLNINRLQMRLESEPATDPYRLPEVSLTIFLGEGVTVSAEKERAIQRLAENCPVANTLAAAPPIQVHFIKDQ